MKTIVVSGITLRKGGTLTILREALAYLSELAATGDYRIVALVHRRELCEYPNIEYIEFPLEGWFKRLWHEYFTMRRISRDLAPVALWLSMHDVTPRVEAEAQAVYCQTSFPFYRWKWRDFRFDPKIPLFALFTRLYYRINVHRNKYLIVQQQWLREGLSHMIGVRQEKIIVAPPQQKAESPVSAEMSSPTFTFLYASTPDCHKNFETLCRAATLLEQEVGKGRFRVVLTVRGDENAYARWLHHRWGATESIVFHGLMDHPTLFAHYRAAQCLVFPSNIETWGLPISEYMKANGGPMILSDLPYAHATASGSSATAYFTPDDAHDLKRLMREILEGNLSHFSPIAPAPPLQSPVAHGWQQLFDLLLK